MDPNVNRALLIKRCLSRRVIYKRPDLAEIKHKYKEVKDDQRPARDIPVRGAGYEPFACQESQISHGFIGHHRPPYR